MRRIGVSCICAAIFCPSTRHPESSETTKPWGNQNRTILQPATRHFVQAAQPGDCPGSPAWHAVHANAPDKSGLPVVTRGICTQMGRILVDGPGVRFLCCYIMAYLRPVWQMFRCTLHMPTLSYNIAGWLVATVSTNIGQEYLEFSAQNMSGLNFHVADWKESALPPLKLLSVRSPCPSSKSFWNARSLSRRNKAQSISKHGLPLADITRDQGIGSLQQPKQTGSQLPWCHGLGTGWKFSQILSGRLDQLSPSYVLLKAAVALSSCFRTVIKKFPSCGGMWCLLSGLTPQVAIHQ